MDWVNTTRAAMAGLGSVWLVNMLKGNDKASY